MAATAVDQKLLRQTKFPSDFNQKVDMQKVNIEVLKKWIAGKISEILGTEDDIVIELCFNLLEGSRYPDIKSLQIQLTGFLDKDTPRFCKDLWGLCLSAQSNPQGVPKELLEAKKLELMQEKIDAEKAAELAKRRRDLESTQEQDINAVRQRERSERVERGRGRGGFRGGRGFDARRSRDSRSPPPPRRRSPYRGPPPRRDADSWVPSGRNRPRNSSRGRSPTQPISRSPSRSRSPPHRPRRSGNSNLRASPLPQRRRRDSSSLPREKSPYRAGRKRSVSSEDRRGTRSRSLSSSLQTSRRRQRSPSSTPSRSPPRRRGQRQRLSSPSRSRSRSRRVHRSSGARLRRPPSVSSRDDQSDQDADIVRQNHIRDNPRLSRSPDPAPQRRRRSSSRRRSRSVSRDRDGARKRRRSMQRWGRAGHRHRNASSGTESSPDQKRRRKDSLSHQPATDSTEARGDHEVKNDPDTTGSS